MQLRSRKARWGRWLAIAVVVEVVVGVLFVWSDLYPAVVLRSEFCASQRVASTVEGVRQVSVLDDYGVVVNLDSAWNVIRAERVTACDNRPGLKKIYVTVLDEEGVPLRGVKVRFDTAPSEGIAYDHRSIWGLTDEYGYLEWDHFGVPTCYWMWVGDEAAPLVTVRTDFGNEYCKPLGSMPWSGNRPVNRPGIYSWRLEVQAK